MSFLRQSRSPNQHLPLLEPKLSARMPTAHISNMLMPKPTSCVKCSIKTCKCQKRRKKRQNLRFNSIKDKVSSRQKKISRRWKLTRSTTFKGSSTSRIKNSRTRPPSLTRCSFRCFMISSLLSQCSMLNVRTKEGRSLIKAGPLDRPIKRRLSAKESRESSLTKN